METKKAPQIPYGISDFVRMRTENYYYVDKTMYLPLIEDTASYIFMIRPRRFGKSLLISQRQGFHWKDWKNVLRLIAMLSSTCS